MTSEDDRRHSTTVGEVMSSTPVTVPVDSNLWSAMARLVEHGLRHLVVIDEKGRCVGVLDDRRVAAHWPEDIIRSRATVVRDLLPAKSPCLPRGAALRAAARAMLDYGTDAVVVIDEDIRPLGIVTGSDLIRALDRLAANEGAARDAGQPTPP